MRLDRFAEGVTRHLGGARDSTTWRLAIATALATVFLVDLWVPLGFNVASLYLPIVFASVFSGSRRFVLAVTGTALVLVLVGIPLAPPIVAGGSRTLIAVNRGIAFAGIGVCGLLAAALLHAVQEFAAAHASLRSARDALVQKNQLLQVASDAGSIGGWTVDLPEGRVTWSDEVARMHGMPAGYSPTLDQALAHYAPEYATDVQSVFWACAKEGLPFDAELQIVTAAGQRVWVRSVGHAARDGSGAIVGVHGAFQDITGRKAGERERTAHLRRFRELADAMPMVVWTAEADGKPTFVTEALSRYTGIERDKVLRRWPSILHPDDRHRCLQQARHCVRLGQPHAVECRLRRYDDVYRWHLARVVPAPDGQGRVVKWYGTATDIDDQKRLEQTSHEAVRRLNTTLDRLADAFIVVDRQWRLVYVNAAAERNAGRMRDDLLGRVLWDVSPTLVGSRFEREYRRALLEDTATSFEAYFEPTDAWLEVHAHPSAEGLSIYYRDITKRLESQAQLRLLETAVGRLNDIVLITEAGPIDEPGPGIVFVNDAFERRTGYKRDEVLGRSPRFLQGPDTERAELNRIREAMEKWQPVRTELLNYTKSGEPFRIELDIVPIADDTGWFTHWVSVERDVTERHALEEQLRRSQRLESVGQLTGGVAHDFNNLLTVILGNAELLMEQLAGDARLAPMAGMVVAAADRGAELTHHLLAFARKQPLAPQAVDLNRQVGELNALVRRTLGEHIEIALVQDAGLWPAMVDPAQLDNALLNLCLNCRDAMPDGGRLTIETANAPLGDEFVQTHPYAVAGDYVLIAVSDTGVGIAPNRLARVFEPFFTTKQSGKGTGLGLAMVYGFAKQSGGHVDIDSELGLGTTVKLYLPRATGQSHRPELAPRNAHITGGSETILLVEDDELVRCYAHDQLVALGYRVIDAHDGARALELLRTAQPVDLLFTDVVMPGMSGRQLADQAQAMRPALKVLYTSGYTDDAIVHHGRLDPGVQLLTKPYRRDELARRVRDVLA